jgi:hypothetical protein
LAIKLEGQEEPGMVAVMAAEEEAKAKEAEEMEKAKTERLDAVAKVFNTAESTLVQLCSAATCAVLTTADQECDVDIGLDVSKQFTDRLESAAEQVFTPKDRYYDFATRVVMSLLQIVGEKGAALVEGVSGADLIACKGVIDIAKMALVAGPDRTITVEIKGLSDALGNKWNGNRTLHGFFGTFRMSHRVANGRPVYGLVDSNSNAKGCHGNFHYKELQVNIANRGWCAHGAWFASGCWHFGYEESIGLSRSFTSVPCDASSLDQIPSGARWTFNWPGASSSTDFTVKGTETTSAATIDGIMAMPGMVAVMAAEEEAKAKEAEEMRVDGEWQMNDGPTVFRYVWRMVSDSTFTGIQDGMFDVRNGKIRSVNGQTAISWECGAAAYCRGTLVNGNSIVDGRYKHSQDGPERNFTGHRTK